ncbi:MAG TPA: hypothetical protein VHY80_06750 [Stellaceae bacterium]|nr:hypothetical protein [Stellaceae bacterium]
MSSAPVASLSAALLVTKGNAQPSRGLAQPMTERLGFAMRAAATHDTRHIRPTEATSPVAPVTWPTPQAFVPPPSPPSTAASRITLRVDDKQRLRLRLASAHLGKSRQVILIDALDHYLKRVMPSFLHDPCPCIQGESATGGECCQRNDSL